MPRKCFSRFGLSRLSWEGMWKLTVVMRRVIYKMTTGLQFLSMCCCDSGSQSKCGSFWHANSCYNNWPLVDGIARCVPRKKIPENQSAGLLLASSSTLRSCLVQARAFLTRRNHLSASARWADPNLRFGLIPMLTPPTPGLGNLQIALFFLRLALVLRLHLRLEEL